MPSISVKVPVVKVIVALEKKLKELKDALADYPKLKAEHKKAVEAWRKSAASHITGTPDDISVYRHGCSNGKIKVEITYLVKESLVGKEPEAPDDPDCASWRQTSASTKITEIEQALRLLKMSDDEYVNASTFKKVSEYL